MLAADFANLGPDLDSMSAAGADLWHLDIMDGHFVPNLTFGPFICAAIRRLTSAPLDAHLMISRPDLYLEPFAEAGVDALTIHVEAEADVKTTLARIGELGLRRGLSLNPGTALAEIEPYLAEVDLLLVMSVQPGFGGQQFDPVAVEKISELARLRREGDLGYLISVDGGINDQTGGLCRGAGADILVSGSWLFGTEPRADRVRLLRQG